MTDLSVVICAHNPRLHYLRRVLKALQNQTLSKHQWELLLIDNASVRPLAAEWELAWHPNARHLLERQVGLSAARLRGMRESSANVIVFVDDDNLLEPGYLSVALRIGQEWPRLGTWGSGWTIPEYELQPAEALKDFLPYLALREADVPRWGNVPVDESMPWGAGLCVRREVAEAYYRHSKQARLQITDRKGNLLLSGGDVEISHVACDIGFGMGVFPELRLTHLIPKERVSKEYLLKMFQAATYSSLLVRYKWNGWVPLPPFRPRGLLSIAKNLILKRGLDRQRYLANLHAIAEARRVIDADRKVG